MMDQTLPAAGATAAPPTDGTMLYLYGIFDSDQYQEAGTWAFLRREDRDAFQLQHLAALYNVTLTGSADEDRDHVWAEYNDTDDRLQVWTAELPVPTPTTLADELARLRQDGPWYR
jgi:hypothetical protein